MRTSRLFGGRPDEDPGSGAPPLDFKVERFDYVPVDAANALLRVTGIWGSAPGAVAPTLVVEVSGQVLQLEALPDLPTAAGAGSEGRRWRGNAACHGPPIQTHREVPGKSAIRLQLRAEATN